jgi:abnormal spindle-like microcephaly-associated protein
MLMSELNLTFSNLAFQIENFSVSFSDGRALCYLLHHYYPSFLKQEEISDETSQQQQNAENLDGSLNDSLDSAITYNYGSGAAFSKQDYEKCLDNEKQNFKLLFSKVCKVASQWFLILSFNCF